MFQERDYIKIKQASDTGIAAVGHLRSLKLLYSTTINIINLGIL